MKIIVVSDSHSLKTPLDQILQEHSDADYFLHCGDICLDTFEYPQYITVQGNNDYYDYPLDLTLKVGNHKIYMLHSHTLSYFKREEKMIERAKKNGCDIVCYGHTHVAYYDYKEGIHILNPGSVYHSRDGRAPSYAVLTINDETDEVNIDFRFLKD